MPKCCYCGGRGWIWVGVASNADRVPCEPCGGGGRGRLSIDGVIGVLLVLISAFIVFGIIHFSVTFAHGQTAGAMTLREFRQLPGAAKIGMVAGAMAATEHVGMRCPDPQRSVSEYVSILTYRATFTDTHPWIEFYFRLVDEHGCRVEESEGSMDPKEGA